MTVAMAIKMAMPMIKMMVTVTVTVMILASLPIDLVHHALLIPCLTIHSDCGPPIALAHKPSVHNMVERDEIVLRIPPRHTKRGELGGDKSLYFSARRATDGS